MKRKMLAVLLICGLTIFGVGCSKKQQEEATVQSGTGGGTRTVEFVTKDLNADLHPVRLVTTSVQGEESQKLEVGIKGGEYYMDFNTQELGNTTLIFKKDVIYSISHDNKLVVVTDNTSELAGEDPLEIFDISRAELANLPAKTGTDTLNDKSYEYEEFTKDDTSIRFLFEGNVCKAVKTTTQGLTDIMIIESYDQNMDESKLQPPDDYQTQKGI